jgi:hypothetical protein
MVEFKVGVLSWAHHTEVENGNGGTRKPTVEEIRHRFGLTHGDQISKWRRVQYQTLAAKFRT